MSVEKGRWVLGIADDLTGALEVGACFPGSTVTTQTTLARRPQGPALVIDTETRHLPAEEAAEVVYRAVLSALPFEPWLIYKKTDSTLRGNIAAEFGSLLQALPEREIVYVPAYPEMGRTVRDGQLLVDGIPVHESAFAQDTLNPVLSSDIRGVCAGLPVTILDGESTEDVTRVAREIAELEVPPIAAGPAALARCLRPSVERVTLPQISRCVVVNGSTHPVSEEQIRFAKSQGCLDGSWFHHENAACSDGLERAAQTGEQVRQVLEAGYFEALAVFGGDTALGIHRAVGSQDFNAWGELAPGVPLSRCGDLFWITKAGGFGAPNLLCDIRNRLR